MSDFLSYENFKKCKLQWTKPPFFHKCKCFKYMYMYNVYKWNDFSPRHFLVVLLVLQLQVSRWTLFCDGGKFNAHTLR